jgi:hypothetical protein
LPPEVGVLGVRECGREQRHRQNAGPEAGEDASPCHRCQSPLLLEIFIARVLENRCGDWKISTSAAEAAPFSLGLRRS